MASEQMSRHRDDNKAMGERAIVEEKDKMKSHFENLSGEANKGSSPSEKEKSHEFVSLADKVSEEQREKERDFNGEKASSENVGKFEGAEDKDRSGDHESNRPEQPSLEEISNMRAQAQQRSTEAIRAAEERYTKALQTAKEGLSTAAEKGSEAAAGVKERAVAAGWTAAHFSTEKAVEGTEAAARVVKGAAEIAVKPISAAKDAAVSAGESVKDYTFRKKEEATRDLEAKQRASQKQETESEGVEKKDERYSQQEESGQPLGSKGQSGTSTTMLGAIGETIVEIAQTTKDLVIGEDKTHKQQEGDEIKHRTSSDQSY